MELNQSWIEPNLQLREYLDVGISMIQRILEFHKNMPELRILGYFISKSLL